MNVIFLDIEGVLDTIHGNTKEDIERRIKLLGEICRENDDCKVVLESTMKDGIDEETGEVYSSYVQFILDCFKKYGIEYMGRTPTVTIHTSPITEISVWKEHEIRLFLYRHPEIDHYCVIDDDDQFYDSDLNKVRNHLVTPLNKARTPEEEGLHPVHKYYVRKALEEENEIKRYIKRRDRLREREKIK